MASEERTDNLLAAPPGNAERGLTIREDQMSDMDTIGGDLVSSLTADNFDGDNLHKMALELVATGPDSVQGSDLIGKEITFKYWYVHRVTLVKDDGEVITPARTVLIAPDMTSVQFTSKGVFDVLRLMVKRMGRVPLVPPITCMIREVKTRGKNRLLVLVPILNKK
jgi:hypothetical protein